jgi:hypothetical protein
VRTVVVLVQEAGRSEFAASPGRVWCGSVERLIDEYAERTFFIRCRMCARRRKNDTREGEPYGGSIEAQGAVVESEKAHVCSECTFFSFVAADVLTLAVLLWRRPRT